jgi:ABC-type Fe3+-hydroxamate transport system substrate-binding protein
MKKLFALLTVFVFVGFIGIGFATAKTAKAAKVKHEVMTGNVVSVDALANKVVVKDAKGEETIVASANTKVELGGKPAKIAELQTGEKVTVMYAMKGGKKVATDIKVVK